MDHWTRKRPGRQRDIWSSLSTLHLDNGTVHDILVATNPQAKISFDLEQVMSKRSEATDQNDYGTTVQRSRTLKFNNPKSGALRINKSVINLY